uniref:5'-deoxynucleotidase HDDC2 n=1 Tax=Ascaris suum TaxID=6253 RepID=F1LCH7_ASCSU
MTEIFKLLEVLDSLKHLKRTGWVRRNVPEPETVASHMYRMAMLAMTLQDDDIDHMKCVQMALVHDLGEAIAGDITPHCGVSDEVKFQLEEKAFMQISSYVPELVGNNWISLWREYEANESKEANIVKHLDKFDMIAQAFAYEQKFHIDLEEFFVATHDFFYLEPFVTWDRELRLKRNEWRKSNHNMNA